MKNLKNRTLLFSETEIDNNLEFDIIDKINIDYDAFPTLETTIVVRQHHLTRIDLLSYDVYGSSYYWWLIADRNDIIDAGTELYTGQILQVPSLTDYFDFYNKNIKVKTKQESVFSVRPIT